VVEKIRFRDHHRYTVADIDRLAELGRRVGCDAFVTTAKDEVKLDAAMRLRLNTVAPVQTAALTVEIEDEGAALDDMRKSLIVTAP
jgi:tetraacyldisaccharide 4'-kinase